LIQFSVCLVLLGKHPKSIHVNKLFGDTQNQFLKSIVMENSHKKEITFYSLSINQN